MTHLLVPAGLTLLAVFITVAAIIGWYHSHGRHPAPQEPPHVPATTGARTVLLSLVRHLVQCGGPVPVHEGATETWSPARAVAAVTQAAELTTAPEQMVADHHALDAIGEAIDNFDALIEAALDRLLRDMPRERMRITAGAETTGEFNRGELDALLAVTG